jgi:hypothetical protein
MLSDDSGQDFPGLPIRRDRSGDRDKTGANGRPRFCPLAFADAGRRGSGVKITVQIAVESMPGQPEVIRQVACLERGLLRPEALGLSLAEAPAMPTKRWRGGWVATGKCTRTSKTARASEAAQ